MKRLVTLFHLLFFISLSAQEATKILPNGMYWAILDQQFKNDGWNDFEFHLENDSASMKIAEEFKNMKVVWSDEDSFIVVGFTEPENPTAAEIQLMNQNKISFHITKVEKNEFYFRLGSESENNVLCSGKFVQSE